MDRDVVLIGVPKAGIERSLGIGAADESHDGGHDQNVTHDWFHSYWMMWP